MHEDPRLPRGSWSTPGIPVAIDHAGPHQRAIKETEQKGNECARGTFPLHSTRITMATSPPPRWDGSRAFIPRGLWPPTPIPVTPNTALTPPELWTSTFQPSLPLPPPPPLLRSFVQPPLPCPVHLSPRACLSVSLPLLPLIFLLIFPLSSCGRLPITKEAMVLLTALLLSLVFLASLANILFRLPPKKLPALLRTLFAEPPVQPPSPAAAAAAASSSAARSEPDGGGAAVAAAALERPRKERPDMSAERRTELRRVFATFDRNGDGHITREELRESLRGLRISVSDAEVEEAVTESDANGDGRIDLDEFCGLLESVSAVGKAGGGGDGGGANGESGGEAELKEAFDVFDRDGDGVITVEELGRVLSSLGMSEGKRAEACEEMIRKVDVDGDGMVNFDEFKRMMRGGQTLLVSAY
ncbi:hypothetical protein NL676_033209 [Syzygium grande]|nr:hypothetical protein NL676_033209 [Syzygium grande]